MSKRGIVLLLALVVFLVLSVLAAAFFTRSISENNLVRRQVASTQALWYAEEGIARGIAQLTSSLSLPPSIPVTGSDSNVSGYDAEIQSSSDETCGKAFQIVSTGSVFLGASAVSRTIESFVRLDQLTGGGFDYAIEVNGPLDIKNEKGKAVEILPNDKPDADYCRALAGVSFTRFGFTSDELRAYAQSISRYYEDTPIADIPFTVGEYPVTWIKNTDPTKDYIIPTSTKLNGGGILVIEGSTSILGGIFKGIIWVIGELRIAGNVETFGTIISECDTEVTTDISGTPALTWDQGEIDLALQGPGSALARRTPLSWRETP
jgi:hypothetical protein